MSTLKNEEVLDRLSKQLKDLKLSESLWETVAVSQYSASFDNLIRKIYSDGFFQGIKSTLEELEKIYKNEE